MSETFLRRHVKLYERYFRPLTGSARSIDGSKVVTVGVININFRLGRTYRSINCRVVRNLIHDFVLGWDFFSKYDAQLHAKEGFLLCEGEKINLIEDTQRLAGVQYAAADEIVIPPRSKAHFPAALLIDSSGLEKATDTVCLEPFDPGDSEVCTARSICKVDRGRVTVEAMNPFEHPIKISEGTVLGFAEFFTDQELEGISEYAGMDVKYDSEDSAYESMDETDAGSESEAESCHAERDFEEEVIIGAAAGPNEPQKTGPAGGKPTSPPSEPPKGAPAKEKEWCVDYSKMAAEAKPYEAEIRHLFEVKHANVLASHERDYGCTNLTKHHARLIDKTPIATAPYRTSPDMQEVIDKQVNEMLADGLVSHSTSAYSAPILMVRKKEPGKWRFVTDFRKVNAATQKVIYPLPRIEDALQRLKNPQFFSSLDLVKGFWQVPIAEEDRHVYAFSTGNAHVEYNVMPMGAKNSTSTLQALMQLLMRGLPAEHVVCFLDDILIASPTIEEHIAHLDKVLTALGRANLKLHPKKCVVARDSAACLGHLLNREGIQPDPYNLEKVVKWPTPKNVKEVRGFLGLTGYYRQFVSQYSKVAEPLTNLTAKEKEWVWGEAEQTSFETLRKAVTEAPVVAYPDFDKPFWLKTDASGGSVGYVLTQFHEEKERVISYGSKKLDATQRRWATYDREFYGILVGVRDNRHYLRAQKFFVVTDHRPLLAWRKQDAQKDVTGRRMRWVIELESYDFELIYRQGRIHSDADALSRLQNADEDCATDHDDLEGLTANEPTTLLGMEDEDSATAVKYTCLSSYLKKLRYEQDCDPKLSNFKGYVRQRRRPPKSAFDNWYRRNFKNFILKNGVLFLKRLEPLTDLVTLRAVLPPSLVPEVLKDAHGSMLAGHPGKTRMVAKLERSVVWESMAKDVSQHVEKCKECDLLRENKPKIRTPLQPVVARRVGDHIICDLLKLPTAPGNFNYVLVCMDIFSKFVNLYKLRTKEAPGVANCIQDLCLSRGFPKKLGTDNGSEFDNHILNSAAKLMGIEKATSVVYRPQSQGAVERHNRQIIAELQKRLEQHGKSWTEHLPFVQYAYNSTPHSKTGESPFRVVFGREPPLPNFEEVDIDPHKDKSVRKYVEDLRKRLASIHSGVRKKTDVKVEKEREQYDRKAKHSPLKEGDLAYEKENVKSSKLSTNWKREPVKVLKRCKTPQGTEGYTYVVKRSDGSEHRRNLEQLKPVRAEFPKEEDEERPRKQEDIRAIPWLWDSDSDEALTAPPTVRPQGLPTTTTTVMAPPIVTITLPPPQASAPVASSAQHLVVPNSVTPNITTVTPQPPQAMGPAITPVQPAGATAVPQSVPTTAAPPIASITLPAPPIVAPVVSQAQPASTPTMVVPTITTVNLAIPPGPSAAAATVAPEVQLPAVIPIASEAATVSGGTMDGATRDTGATRPKVRANVEEGANPIVGLTRTGPLRELPELGRILSVRRSPSEQGSPIPIQIINVTPVKGKGKGKKSGAGNRSLSRIAANFDCNPDTGRNAGASESIGSFTHFLRKVTTPSKTSSGETQSARPGASEAEATPLLVLDRAQPQPGVDHNTSKEPQQSIDQPPYPNSENASAGRGAEPIMNLSVAVAYEDSVHEEQGATTAAVGTPPTQERQTAGSPIALPGYRLRKTKSRERYMGSKRSNSDMEPPIHSPQSAKCILYDQPLVSAHPRLDFVPSQEQLQVITFQQQSAEDGTGRASAYRASPRPLATGSDAGGATSIQKFGADTQMEAEDESD